MKNPNGYGTIKKLNGKRRRPYAVYITTDYTITTPVPDISFLAPALPPELYSDVQNYYNEYKKKQIPAARQVQKLLGTYENKRDAMLALAQYNRSPYDIDNANITFEEAFALLWERDLQHRKQSSKTAYRTAYEKCTVLQPMKVRDIRLAHLQGVLDQYSSSSKSTQDNLVILYHAIFRICMENDIIEKDYSRFVKIAKTEKKHKKEIFTHSEIETIRNNLSWASSSGAELMDSILVMLYTGLRISELLNLRCSDVHVEERWIDVKGTKTAAARRIVPIHDAILPIIRNRLHYSDPASFLFTINGKKLNRNRYKTAFYYEFQKVFNVERSPHECRHTFITRCTSCGVNQILLRKMVGHAGSGVTEQIYTHAEISEMLKEISKLKL